jgi:hypothetical protein
MAAMEQTGERREDLDDTCAIAEIALRLLRADLGDEFDDNDPIIEKWHAVAEDLWRRGWLDVSKMTSDRFPGDA